LLATACSTNGGYFFIIEEMSVNLAIFDLDNTLIAGDSDYLWGTFLVEKGIVDGEAYQLTNEHFYEQYRNGSLDIAEFLRFALKPLADNDTEKLYRWREDFIEEKIKPILLPAAYRLIDKHRSAGDLPVKDPRPAYQIQDSRASRPRSEAWITGC